MTTLEMPAAPTSTAVGSTRLRMLCVLFFFSGFPVLIYQLTWQRSLFRFFGVDTELVTIIVTAFMVGLGLGSLAGGWISKRKGVKALLLLGLIELLTAVFGLISLAIFEQVGQLVSDLPLAMVAAINLLLVLVPTLLMGATLPLLVSHLVKTSGQIGSAVGTLYFVNTLGAGAACLAGATIIFPFVGMQAAIWIAAGINVMVGVGAILAHRMNRDQTEASRFVAAEPAAQPILGMPFVTSRDAQRLHLAVVRNIPVPNHLFCDRIELLRVCLHARRLSFGDCGRSTRSGAGLRKTCAARCPPKSEHGLDLGQSFGAAFLPVMAQFAWTGSGAIGIAIGSSISSPDNGGRYCRISRSSVFPLTNGPECKPHCFIPPISLVAHRSRSHRLFADELAWPVADGYLPACRRHAVYVLLIGALEATARERLCRSGIAVAVLAIGTAAISMLAHRVYENLQNKGFSDHAFAHIVENRSGIITVDADGTVFGNGMYDGRFSTDLKADRNGIIRPYALSLFHGTPRNVLMIGLSSGSWAQVIASNPAVESRQLSKSTVAISSSSRSSRR